MLTLSLLGAILSVWSQGISEAIVLLQTFWLTVGKVSSEAQKGLCGNTFPAGNADNEPQPPNIKPTNRVTDAAGLRLRVDMQKANGQSLQVFEES